MSAKSVVWHMVRYQLFGGWRTFVSIFCVFSVFILGLPSISDHAVADTGGGIFFAFIFFSIAPQFYSVRLGKASGNSSDEFVATRGVSRNFIFYKQLTISLLFLVVPMIATLAATSALTQGDGNIVLAKRSLDGGIVGEITPTDALKSGEGLDGEKIDPLKIPHGVYIFVPLFFLVGWLCHMAIISSWTPGIVLHRMFIFLGLGLTVMVMIRSYFSPRLLLLQGYYWLSLYPLLTLVGIVLTGVLATWLAWRRFRRAEIV